MVETLEVARRAAGRQTNELTRRDIAQALLAVPSGEALATLAQLRQELAAAGNPLSDAFWDSAQTILAAIEARTATVGEVHQWLEATGSEPAHMIISEGFVWPEEDERGPVAVELHAALVTHLTGLVAAGTIDPDRLLAGDEAARADYLRAQVDWFRSPLPDGRVPWDALIDEEDEQFLAEWDEAEAEARQVVQRQVVELGPRPCPQGELQAVCARLRAELSGADPQLQVLRAAAQVDPAELPADDRDLWLTLAAGVISQWDLAPEGVLDDESQAAWSALDHWDWAGAVLALADNGPRTVADPVWLARQALAFEPELSDDGDEAEADLDEAGDLEDDLDDDLSVDDFDDDDFDELDEDQDELALSIGFATPVLLWRTLGAVDDQDRLTELGWWGLPESLLHAWQPVDEKG